MNYAQLTPGLVIEAGPREVTEAEILEFARRYDPQYFHADPARAAASRWGGLIASGWLTGSIAMQLAVQAILDGSDSIGSPGLEKLEWTHPVRPGDRLKLKVTVLEQTRSKSGRTGVVNWRWELFNQAETLVLRVTAVSLFDLKDGVGSSSR